MTTQSRRGPFSWLFIVCMFGLLAMPWLGCPAWSVAMIAVTVSALFIGVNHGRQSHVLENYQLQKSASGKELARCREALKDLDSQSRLGASALLQLIDGVIVLSTDLSIQLINPSAVKLLGLQPRESLTGRSFSELVRAPKLMKLIRTAIAERLPQDSVIELNESGGVLPLRVRADVIEDGESFRVQLSLRDETESRQLEGMRREFVANVSHELKTPLAAIKGYAETVELAATDDPEMAIHFMNQIVTQCHRLERLISDMMQLARAQSGRSLMQFSSVPLREIVSESVQTYEPVAVASGLTLTLHDGAEQAKVLADTEATLTICNNLIGNAIRYTPRGGKIDVRLARDADCWTLIVEDTGVGIAEQDQTKIFERFYRGSKNAEMATSSTGLGLAIVKNLTSALGGAVRVESTPGKGSTFYITFPAVETTNRVPPLENAAVSSDGRQVTW